MYSIVGILSFWLLSDRLEKGRFRSWHNYVCTVHSISNI